LAAEGRLELASSTDSQALAALRLLARSEGILPALEPAHAIAALPRALEGAKPGTLVLLGLSGRGDKDIGHLADPA
jgi:tryptophan synthase beta chain